MGEGDRRFELNWVQSLAGALAAVTSAVLLSTVGVAGTLIGAALGSLAATVGSAVYSYYIGATRDRVATAGTVAATKIGHGRSRGPSPADAAETPPSARAVLAGLPWKRIIMVATGLFVAAMVVILAFELVTGRALSSYTGGSDSDRHTSIPGLGGGRGQDDPSGDQDEPQPTPGEAPSDEPEESSGRTEQPAPAPAPTAATEESAVPPSTDYPGGSATSGSTPSPTSSPTPAATTPATGSPPPSP